MPHADSCPVLDKIGCSACVKFTLVFQMAEIRQLDRAQPLGRAAVVDAGTAPPRSVARFRRMPRAFNPWLWGIVGLPSLIAGVYYFAIASDLYLSEAKFIVRSPKQVQTSGIGALLQSTGLSRAAEDTSAVQDFIMSRDAVRELEQKDDLRTLLSRPHLPSRLSLR